MKRLKELRKRFGNGLGKFRSLEVELSGTIRHTLLKHLISILICGDARFDSVIFTSFKLIQHVRWFRDMFCDA